jgi:hypothetical protein
MTRSEGEGKKKKSVGRGWRKKDPIRLPLIGISNCKDSRKSMDCKVILVVRNWIMK